MKKNRSWLKEISPSLIIYDLDGTLVNSLPDISHAINEMRVHLSLSAYNEHTISNWIGKGEDNLIKQAMSDAQVLHVKAKKLYRQYYGKISGSYSVIYPGVRHFLDCAEKQGIIQAVVTNKPFEFAEHLLTEKGLRGYFSVIYGGDSLPEHKPHPMPLLQVMKETGVSAKNTIMIGDSVNDIQAAKAASVRSLGLTYGYNHGQPISQEAPDWVVDGLETLLA